MLKDIRIGNKLLIILTCNILLLVALGALAAYSANSINNNLEEVYSRDLQGLVFLLEADRDLHQAFIAERTMIYAEPGTEVFDAQLEDYTANKGQADTRVGKFADTTSDPGQQALVAAYFTGRQAWDEISEDIVAQRQAGADTETLAARSLGDGITRFDNMRENINLLTEELLEQADAAHTGATESFNKMLIILIALTVGSALIGALFTLLVTRNITRPMAKLVDFTKRLASGDFPPDLGFKRRDEVGTLSSAFDNMNHTLQENMREIEAKTQEAHDKAEAAEVAMRDAEEAREAAEHAKRDGMLQAADQLEQIVTQVASASDELNSQIQESRRGSQVQRERTAEAATAMEEMNATVLEVAGNASHAAENADSAKQQAVEGGQVVQRVVQSIDQLNTETEQLHSEMSDLGTQAEAIGQIMTVISDIADQTNLLALNAAIEAARAGDAGRGFAVVADEVRKLAEKTMTATQEVGNAISSIQNGTKKSMLSMDQTAKVVANSTELTEEAGKSLNQIIEIIENTADQVRSIATASEEQSAASEEISKGSEEINAIASETEEAMAQSAAAMEDLARLSDQLRMLIDELKQA
ncbi:MAG: methyl-accepting chemotaxis protein [Desulfovibrio sp.]|nr:MAG: methyl-accepting chemotaxis protein [Desulfovibrio sp.]